LPREDGLNSLRTGYKAFLCCRAQPTCTTRWGCFWCAKATSPRHCVNLRRPTLMHS